MVLNQSLFCKRPESLDPVDVDLSLLKFVPMVDVEMLITAEHERIISSPFIGIHNRASSHPLHRFRHEALGGDILDDTYRDLSSLDLKQLPYF